jgi:molecular chaperone HscA
MAIHVVQGERELVSDCRSLARFELRGIPPMPAGAARIRVTFQVDADGLLAVTARESTSGVEATVAVKPSYGLTDDEVTRLLKESMGAAQADTQERALREQQVDGRRLLEAVRTALAADSDLLSADERSAIDARMQAVEQLIGGRDTETLHAAVEALSRATDEFAARRMDRSIRAALSGKRVDELAK